MSRSQRTALVRAMGIPGRYVSGYFHPNPKGAIDEKVAVESHAWAEVWLGEWWPIDPTNEVPVGSRHVLMARGRSYRDVTPLKGVYSGSPSSPPPGLVEMPRRA
ncbi:MAG: transglutaminase family protein [Acidimicrobiales bacterium]